MRPLIITLNWSWRGFDRCTPKEGKKEGDRKNPLKDTSMKKRAARKVVKNDQGR